MKYLQMPSDLEGLLGVVRPAARFIFKRIKHYQPINVWARSSNAGG